MELKFYFFYSLLLVSGGCTRAAEASQQNRHHHHHHHGRPDHETLHHGASFRLTKLFVFGDSYADTGNVRKSLASSWKAPYGITFPEKPAGRYSDGRVLTDYIAKSMGISTPVGYRWMKIGGTKLRNGMNFAYGGSGVFDTYSTNIVPNMTTQIDFLQKLMNDSIFTKWDLKSSLVLVSLAGNDYGSYRGPLEDLPEFISLVINQLSVNIRRIQRLGATRIAVTSLEPLGCLPQATAMYAFQQCNETQNILVSYHNQLLNEAVARINNETKESSVFAYDLFGSFSSLLRRKGSMAFESSLLKPCCVGIGSGNSCGSIAVNGTKMYSVCSEPKSSFFWDLVHPTQAGWQAVHTTLKTSLEQFLVFY